MGTNWTPGAPPADSPWRCSYILRSGRQCRAWATATPETKHLNWREGTPREPSGLCRAHSRWRDSGHLFGTEGLPVYYRRVLSVTLRERLDQALARPDAEQLRLHEELALMREAAAESVGWYSRTEELMRLAEQSHDLNTIEHARAVLADASRLMMSDLERVGDFAMRIARIEAVSKDAITIHTLYSVLAQVTRTFYRVCGTENQHLAQELERAINDDVKVPGLGTDEGTDRRPADSIVDAMDLTVPSVVDSTASPTNTAEN